MVYNTLYIVKAFGSAAERVRWQLYGEPIIKRTIRLIESVSKEAKRVILTDNADHLRDVCLGERIVETTDGSAFLKNENKIKKYGALVFIDPLRPFITQKDLANALSKYFCQDKKRRHTLVSVSSVPNQYHPRKVLNIDIDGWLKHYDDSGKMVYQRQQIEDDPYYVINDALRIISPLNAFEDEKPICNCLAIVIEEALFYIRTKDDLKFASALMKKNVTTFNHHKV